MSRERYEPNDYQYKILRKVKHTSRFGSIELSWHYIRSIQRMVRSLNHEVVMKMLQIVECLQSIKNI